MTDWFGESLVVDYRTCAGTKFYNRDRELSIIIDNVTTGSRYFIVYGPRNAGKSELLRYVAHILERRCYLIILVDTRRYLAHKELSIYPYNEQTHSIMDAISELVGLPEGIYRIFRASLDFIKKHRLNGVLWVVDEPYYLAHPRAFLESLIKDTIYAYHDKPVSTIVAVSEGYFIKSRDLFSLINYGAEPLLIDWLDYDSFKMFVEEYLSIKNVSLEISVRELYDKYTGGVPGAFIAIVEQGLSRWFRHIERYLLRVVEEISYTLGIDTNRVLDYIASLPKTLDYSREEYMITEKLLDYNIVYYNPFDEKPLVNPQLPVYKVVALRQRRLFNK